MRTKSVIFLGLAHISISQGMIIKNEPIMASSIPKSIVRQLPSLSHLYYAKGHQFYDTPVTLLDENNTPISYQHQLNLHKRYSLSKVGETVPNESWIWFFRPDGIEQQNNVYDCTVEQPCKNITQRGVDEIAQFISQISIPGQLWLASGAYDLPINPQQSSKTVLELYNNISIIGRSSDYRMLFLIKIGP